jgi:parvulin-like peptidyl-prolyl isomerase
VKNFTRAENIRAPSARQRRTGGGAHRSSFTVHRSGAFKLKKDAIIGFIALLVVAAVCFGLAAVRPQFQPTPSKAFTYDLGVNPQAAPSGKVVIRVNGEPITQTEFEAAFAQLPQEMQRQFLSETGKMAFAEQLVRLKLLEQEARKAGVDQDPKVTAVLAADRTNILASAAAQKIVATPTEEAVRKYYEQNRDKFATVDISHIVFAFQGGKIPPRGGRRPATEQEAVNNALAGWQELRKGADFAALARRESDDAQTAQQGGHLGRFTRGMLPPELEAKVWALQPGQISDPIPSPLGVHIFRLNSRDLQPIDQVRATISQQVRQQNMFDRVEVIHRNSKIDFDPKFFPGAKNWQRSSGKRPS